METERWQEASRILEIALERDPDRRAAYLGGVCANDDELRREVESLLAASERAGSLLDSPAMEMAAPLFVNSSVKSMLGQSIGRYNIVAALGAGGMGEVYLAHDTKLGRQLALKLLPTYFTTDKDRLRRFEQEAHAASTLSHPNVCVIYEVGESENGRHYIAMEFVDGVTLRQHLAGAALNLTEALDIAIQVASALAAAHAAGVVHRDIKPENVMVRSDALVKVLDFGLAKRTALPVTADTGRYPKVSLNTGPGMFMGTVSYMSPEQVRGLDVDARTDIWSLGVMLYEMVTGRTPFAGATASDVIASVLTAEPPSVGQHAEDVYAELEQLVRKALRKESEQRYQTVGDLAVALKSLKVKLELSEQLDRSLRSAVSTRSTTHAAIDTDSELWARTGRPVGSRTTSSAEYLVNKITNHKKSALLIVAVIIIAAAGGSVWLYSSRFASKSLLPPMKVVPFTSFPGSVFHPAFSPDGNQIAYAWGGEQAGNWQIYVKQIGNEKPLRITSDPDPDWNCTPTWSPDGQRIAFIRVSKSEYAIYTVSALGTESERKLVSFAAKEVWGGRVPFRIDWSSDGKFIATIDLTSKQEPPRIFLVSPETGEKRALTSPPAQGDGDDEPAFSPDSQTVAFLRYTVNTSDIYLVPVTGGEPKRLTFDDKKSSCPVWTPDGREIVFTSDRGGVSSLWRIPVSGGTPERLAVGGDNVGRSSISRKGHRLAYVQINPQSVNINRIEVPGTTGHKNSPTTLIASTRTQFCPQFSPDSKSIAFASDRSGSPEIWMCDSEGRNPIQLTSFGGPEAGTPRWSPDGKQLAFDSRAKGDIDIYVLSVEGGLPRRITSDSSEDMLPSWSKDGRWIYFASDRSGSFQVWKVPVEGGAAVQVTKQGGLLAFESADSKFVYYSKGTSVAGLWRVPVEGGEETLVFNLKERYWGNWALVNDGIYFVDPDTKDGVAIGFFSFATHQITQVAGLGNISIYAHGLAASPDHRWILYTQSYQGNRDIMLVENFR
jgi:eukaryotic-like serine/threonine-protein kinase